MAEASAQAPDLFGPEFTRDPYPAYRWLREHSPVHRLQLPQGPPAWLVTRHSDVRALLTDARLAKDLNRFLPEVALPSPDLRSLLTEHMLAHDPPAHTRLRQLVARAFTARRVESLRPRVTEIAERLLDEWGDAGRTDLMQAFAIPLPLTVICELLGVPMTDVHTFHEFSRVASDNQSVMGPEFEAATRVLRDYVVELIAAKREAPGEDLLSDLIAVRDGGDRLTDDELVAMTFLLLLGGHETVVSLISSATLHLLTHPEQLAALRAEPGRIAQATEEFLRYDTPAITTSMRFAAEDLDVGGVRIPAGAVVFLALGSAGRDPAAHPGDPERFDVCRADTQHLAFGAGIHACLGSALARLECQVAITALLARFARLELAVAPEQIDWRPGLHFRGPVGLPVAYAAQPDASDPDASDPEGERERLMHSSYKHVASFYDTMFPIFSHGAGPKLHQRVASLLRVRPGGTVVDAGCGTGLMLGPLRDRVGETGRVIGIDAAEPMLDRARERVAAAGWTNVELHRSDMASFAPGTGVDAVVFALSLSTDEPAIVLANTLGYLRPGANVVIADSIPASGARYHPLVNRYAALRAPLVGSHPDRAREIARLASLHLRHLHTELLLGGMYTIISGLTPTETD